MGSLIDRDQLQAQMARGAQLVEVLPEDEYREDHLPGALSIPLTKLDRDSASILEKGRPVVVYCWDSA